MKMDILESYRALSAAEIKKKASKNGGEWCGPCPACGGNDRFLLWPERVDGPVYWCRGCGKSGDAIQFRRDFLGEDFKTAAAACGKEISSAPRGPRMAPPKRARAAAGDFVPAAHPMPGAAWVEKATALVAWAHEKLIGPDGVEKREWLAARGIGAGAVALYRLGWLPEDMWRPRKSWGLAEEKKDGRDKKLWLPAGIVIPLVIDGACWRIRVRRFAGDGPKYYMLPGSSNRQLVTAGDPRAAVVVESELDALTLAAQIDGAAMAVALGSAAIKPDLPAHKALSACIRILVALDYDDAGAKAWPWWERYGTARRWPVAVEKDPGDAFAAGVDLKARVWGGLPPAMSIGTVGPCVSSCRVGVAGGFEESGRRGAEGEVENGEGGDGDALRGAVVGDRGAPVAVGDVLPAVTRVLALARLMAGCPVRVAVSRRSLRIVQDDGWARANWELAREIGRAVFFDREVSGYLMGLPDGVYAATDIVRLERSAGGDERAETRRDMR